jgi:hypothetical protein
MAFAGARNVLDEIVSPETVSGECRVAALDFMTGVARGWDKIDLALWLTGPYARATSHAARGVRTSRSGDRAIGVVTIEGLLTSTRQRILASLEKAVLSGGALEFVNDAIIKGFVRRSVDQHGIASWIPIDLTRMRLRDRIESLFAADYLDATNDYASLHVCHRCEAVVFDARAKEYGYCSAHVRHSGYVMRDPRPEP